MKVMVMSASEMCRFIERGIPDNYAIVSFADTEDDFLEFPKGTDVLKIAFYDVRPHSTIKEHYAHILPEAEQIAKYIYEKRLEGKDIICQCDYGVSRSAGCAAAILQRWGGNGLRVFADYRYTPNQFVFNKVLTELLKLPDVNENVSDRNNIN